jgi:hypothetical protein
MIVSIEKAIELLVNIQENGTINRWESAIASSANNEGETINTLQVSVDFSQVRAEE